MFFIITAITHKYDDFFIKYQDLKKSFQDEYRALEKQKRLLEYQEEFKTKEYEKREKVISRRELELNVDIEEFDNIVEEFKKKNLVYVDKTRLIYNLVNTPKGLYFLSRPRRFGKTLLLSTLACLFKGKKELFEGFLDSAPH